MDVYVQLPGKAGLGNLGNLGGTASSGLGGGPSSTPAGLRRTQTENSGGSLGSGAGAAPAGTPGGGFGGGASAGSTGGLLGIDLHQIVGAFSCDTDRPPPNLDCALSDWEHFYAIHQQRVAAHQQQQQQQNPRNANTPNSTSLFDLMAAGDSFSMASGVASELSSPIGRSVGSSKGGGGGGFSMAGSTANTKGGWTPTNADTGQGVVL